MTGFYEELERIERAAKRDIAAANTVEELAVVRATFLRIWRMIEKALWEK